MHKTLTFVDDRQHDPMATEGGHKHSTKTRSRVEIPPPSPTRFKATTQAPRLQDSRTLSAITDHFCDSRHQYVLLLSPPPPPPPTMPSKDRLHVENYESWSAQEFAEYLKTKQNLGQYYEMVIQHGITGKVAPTLSENDLKEMGVASIGDRKRFQAAISEMSRSARKKHREQVLWEDDEEMWFSWWEACCSTCCGCCPRDASHYTLTGTHLSIKTMDTKRCGPIRCCCGHEYEIDNVVCRA